MADNLLTDGWDFRDDDDDPMDELGHGTMVCGVIAAIQSNDKGINDIAPKTLVYLLAILGEGAHFAPGSSEVAFESAHLTPLGPPLVFLPTFMLQLVLLEGNPVERYSNVTVTTGTEKFNGYDAITIGLLPWNL